MTINIDANVLEHIAVFITTYSVCSIVFAVWYWRRDK